MSSLRGRIAFVGAADTEVGVVPHKDAIQLCVEAAIDALADAGVRKDQIDGLVTCNSMAQPRMYHAEAIAEYLQIFPRYCVTANAGGGTTFSVIAQAAAAIDAGLCDTVLVTMADSLRSGLSRAQAMVTQASAGHPEFEAPYGATVPGYYALIARAYQHAYNAKPEHFASIAVTCREHAVLHPGAQMRTPITCADVLASRLVADPLRLLDCSLVSDGGAAVILTKASRAQDFPHSPVFLLGFGEAHGHEHISQAMSLTSSFAKHAGERAYAMAGLNPRDIDVAYLYDCFTPVVLIELEDLGFCARGEAGAFVAEGHAKLGGRLPINTHGGLLAHCHPGNPGSMFALTEAITQLRHNAGARQVHAAEIALLHAQGGILSSHATLILGRSH